jgi:thioredoxin type arsenate reductase
MLLKNDLFPLPEFIKLVSNELRWKLLVALARSDYRVNELVELLQHPQNLVSYHLQKLRLSKLVVERRSSADAREVYYSADLEHLQRLYTSAGATLHPALVPAAQEKTAISIVQPVRVLFLCTHNSARSQMAEGIMRQQGGTAFSVFSAGTEPAQVHPMAVRVMANMNIDISQHRSKHLNEFIGQSFDYIITVCDRAREMCPVFPGQPVQLHWSFPDPTEAQGTEQERLTAFTATAMQLKTRIEFLLMMIRRSKNE